MFCSFIRFPNSMPLKTDDKDFVGNRAIFENSLNDKTSSKAVFSRYS